MVYLDRAEAGVVLARQLARFANREDVVVLALPRGGVPVAAEVARVLNAPLDVFVVRKLGLPGHEELAIGAIAPGGVCILNDDVLRYVGLPAPVLEVVKQRERLELERRELLYREGRVAVEIEGRTVILVDDGLATGSSMLAAVEAVRRLKPARVIVAVPVAAEEAFETLRRAADECVSASTPDPFIAVGRWYRDFTQTTDDEVRDILARQNASRQAPTFAGGERRDR